MAFVIPPYGKVNPLGINHTDIAAELPEPQAG